MIGIDPLDKACPPQCFQASDMGTHEQAGIRNERLTHELAHAEANARTGRDAAHRSEFNS